MDPLHIWVVTIDDAARTFPTLEKAIAYLREAYTPAVKTASIESQVLVPEEFSPLRRENVE
jgi:hypothetical protein